jgi:hypothetical protein
MTPGMGSTWIIKGKGGGPLHHHAHRLDQLDRPSRLALEHWDDPRRDMSRALTTKSGWTTRRSIYSLTPDDGSSGGNRSMYGLASSDG